MKEGDIVLTPLPQANGKVKSRPAVFLRKMPPYEDLLVCGVSTQLQLLVPNFDDLITGKDGDFLMSGLLTDSIIRLGFLAVLSKKNIIGSIGNISATRHHRLLCRLSNYLIAHLQQV